MDSVSLMTPRVKAGTDRRASRRPGLEASLKTHISDAVRATCPHCGSSSDAAPLVLNLSLGPIEEGLHVICFREGASMKAVTDRVQRTLVDEALRRARGNYAEAARLVDMKYSTFYALAKRLGGDEAAGDDDR